MNLASNSFDLLFVFFSQLCNVKRDVFLIDRKVLDVLDVRLSLSFLLSEFCDLFLRGVQLLGKFFDFLGQPLEFSFCFGLLYEPNTFVL